LHRFGTGHVVIRTAGKFPPGAKRGRQIIRGDKTGALVTSIETGGRRIAAMTPTTALKLPAAISSALERNGGAVAPASDMQESAEARPVSSQPCSRQLYVGARCSRQVHRPGSPAFNSSDCDTDGSDNSLGVSCGSRSSRRVHDPHGVRLRLRRGPSSETHSLPGAMSITRPRRSLRK